MRKELDLIESILSSPDKFTQKILIRYLIPTDYEYVVLRDTCLYGERVFSDEFCFGYYIELLVEIIERTLKRKRRHNKLVSINCLELVIIIISYNAILDTIELLGLAKDVPHSKSKILSDNKIADSWIRKIGAHLIIGKLLCQIFCSMLIN